MNFKITIFSLFAYCLIADSNATDYSQNVSLEQDLKGNYGYHNEESILINSITNIMRQIIENNKKNRIKNSFDSFKIIYDEIYSEVFYVTNDIGKMVHMNSNIKVLDYILDDIFTSRIKNIENKYNIKESERSLLIILLETIPGDQKSWPYIAHHYLKQGYDPSLLFQLFETRPDIKTSCKLQIFKEMDRHANQKAFLTLYIAGLIAKGEFIGKEILEAISFLAYDRLATNDWLAIIDNMLAIPSIGRDEEEEYNIDQFDITKLLLLSEKYIKYCKGMIYYPNAYKDALDLLIKTKRPFMTDMNIIQHLSQRYAKQGIIRDYLLKRWVGLSNSVNSPLTASEVGIIIQQARIIKNIALVQKLIDRVNHLPKFLKKKSSTNNKTITFVASQEPSGDGKTPETLDYFMGSQYPWLSLVVPELLARGYTVEVLNWEDLTIKWHKKPFLFVGPVWGYSKKQAQFDNWLAKIRVLNIPLINSMAFITWNFMKTYLVELQTKGIPVVPSMAISEASPLNFFEIIEQAQTQWGTSDIILKGLVGAGGFDYHHYKAGHEIGAQRHLETLKANNRGAIIQPFWREISEKGEMSFVFEGNALSHAYLKVCAPGSELVQIFYGGKSFHLNKKDLSYHSDLFLHKLRSFHPDIKVTEGDLATAHYEIHELWYTLKEFFREKNITAPPIARLDCVMREGHLYLMEIEGLDPYLELGEAAQHDPKKNIIKLYADGIIRQHTIHLVKPKRILYHEKGKTIANFLQKRKTTRPVTETISQPHFQFFPWKE